MECCFMMVLILLGAVSFSYSGPQYSAGDFFKDAEPEWIYGVEPISKDEKDLIIESGFAVSGEPVSAFSVISYEPRRLQLRDLDIHLYTNIDGGWVVSVTSILGNHDQNQNTVFYGVSDSGRITGELRPELLGVGIVLNNEFLDEADYFPEEENFPVPLGILHDGSLLASPWTWMDPNWEHREIVNRIMFVWNGRIFDKVVIRDRE